MDQVRAELGKRAKGRTSSPEPQPSAQPSAPASAAQQQSPEAGQNAASQGEGPASTPEAGPTPPPEAPEGAKADKPGKTNPWKLVDSYKTRIATLEKEIAESKTKSIAEEQRKEYLTKIEAAEKRAQELEEHIRFVDYTKSEEFRKKYAEPYEAAWKRAGKDLREIQVLNPETNQYRDATMDDLYALVSMPLGEARKVAKTLFGDFADDVMNHRKSIKELMDAQNSALKEAREKGAEREKAAKEMQALEKQRIDDFLAKTYTEENEAVTAHEKIGRFFKVEEGDEESKAALERGYAIVDEAFRANPSAPGLTEEQRHKAVQLHVALRNRAAAFGRLTAMVAKLESEKAALMKKLEGYQGSTPSTGSPTPRPAASDAPTSVRDSVFAALRSRAK